MTIFGAYIRTQVSGTISLVFKLGSANHRLGAITIFASFRHSHAPHQLKLLLAMMWCEQRLMSHMSWCGVQPTSCVTRTVGQRNFRLSRTQSGSSLNTKKDGLETLSAMRREASR